MEGGYGQAMGMRQGQGQGMSAGMGQGMGQGMQQVNTTRAVDTAGHVQFSLFWGGGIFLIQNIIHYK